MRFAKLLLASVIATAPAGAFAQTAPAKIAPSKIILVGDSTTAVYGGWGPSFCAKHAMHMLACVNMARHGRSTTSYIREGSWDVALAEMKSGGYAKTYVTIQFGHNDQPGKADAVDPETGFAANLRRYVTDARAAGAVPILVTPLTRRNFVDGKLVDTLGPYAEAARKVAAELNVPLVDLYARSTAAVIAMGPVEAATMSATPPNEQELAMARAGTSSTVSRNPLGPPRVALLPGQAAFASPSRAFDNTHLGEKGSDVFSALVVDELARVLPELRGVLVP